MKISDLKPLMLEKWLERPVGERTGNDLLIFYGELEKSHSILLDFKCPGDKFQYLKTILKGHIEK